MATITIDCEARDDATVADAVSIIESILAYMMDNVIVTWTD
jgi:hypothetical protein